MSNILIVEDDKKLNHGICLALKSDDYVFAQCRTIEQASREINNEIDLMLLDLNLPDGNGLDFLMEVRKSYGFPIIIITANNMETDIITGLELGANDYITKPFSLAVLRARVSVQLRQVPRTSISNYNMHGFYFDFDKMIYKVNGQIIELSKTEQKLLKVLIENKGIALTRNQLIDYVWSGDSEYVDEHALTVTIKRLRDKLITQIMLLT